MLDVLRDHRAFFLAQICGLVVIAGLLALLQLPLPVRMTLWTVSALSAGWMSSVLLTSFAVPDRCLIVRMGWLHDRLAGSPKTMAVVHAGLDDAVEELRGTWTLTEIESLDLYDLAETPGDLIARRRAAAKPPSVPARPASAGRLPLADASQNVVILLFALRELRRPGARSEVLREAARIVAGDGSVFVVEQPRTLLNVLGFGPEALGFVRAGEVARLGRGAGLVVREEAGLSAMAELIRFRANEVVKNT